MLNGIGAHGASLRLGLAIWVALQFTVITLSPTWGMVLPHEHITSGTMTDADWEAHQREHALGMHTRTYTLLPCMPAPRFVRGHVLASVPEQVGVVSLLNLIALVPAQRAVEITACALPTHDVLAQMFFTQERFDVPRHPPPKPDAPRQNFLRAKFILA